MQNIASGLLEGVLVGGVNVDLVVVKGIFMIYCAC